MVRNSPAGHDHARNAGFLPASSVRTCLPSGEQARKTSCLACASWPGNGRRLPVAASRHSDRRPEAHSLSSWTTTVPSGMANFTCITWGNACRHTSLQVSTFQDSPTVESSPLVTTCLPPAVTAREFTTQVAGQGTGVAPVSAPSTDHAGADAGQPFAVAAQAGHEGAIGFRQRPRARQPADVPPRLHVHDPPGFLPSRAVADQSQAFAVPAQIDPAPLGVSLVVIHRQPGQFPEALTAGAIPQLDTSCPQKGSPPACRPG